MTEEKKDIKDYLHFYIGCECATVVDQAIVGLGILKGVTFSEMNPGEVIAITGEEFGEWFVHDVIPILRPLSDLQPNELQWWFDSVKRKGEELAKAEWVTEVNGQPYTPHWVLWCKGKSMGCRHGYNVGIDNHFTSLQIKWLLDHSIDLFGLIESGIALDKTKMEV